MIIIILPLVIVSGNLFFRQEKREDDPFLLNVYLHRKKKIAPMELEKYLIGVVAAEMPAAFQMEALKSQAVIARTYTLQQILAKNGRTSEYDISTDHTQDQAWLSMEEMRDRWGYLAFFYYWNRVREAVESTAGQVVYYNDKLAETVYHSNAGGKTAAAEEVWGKDFPYLKSVNSPYDSSGKHYQKERIFSIDELAKIFAVDTITEPLFEVVEKSPSGRIKKIKIGQKLYSGSHLREKLNLPSTKLSITESNGRVLLEIYGYGHGVGLSQEGAEGLANAGADYQEIINHYYPGTVTKKFE